MKRALFLTAALAAAGAASSANAAWVVASFSGTVQSQTGTGLAVGAPVSGNFFQDTTAGTSRVFTIGSQTYVPSAVGAIVKDSVTPDQLTALFQSQNSQTAGAPSNTSFFLDLEGLAKFGSTDPLVVAANLAKLSLDVDPADAPFNSTFGYNIQSPTGGVISSLVVNLTAVTASVPEPASMALMLTSLLGLGAVRRRG